MISGKDFDSKDFHFDISFKTFLTKWEPARSHALRVHQPEGFDNQINFHIFTQTISKCQNNKHEKTDQTAATSHVPPYVVAMFNIMG